MRRKHKKDGSVDAQTDSYTVIEQNTENIDRFSNSTSPAALMMALILVQTEQTTQDTQDGKRLGEDGE